MVDVHMESPAPPPARAAEAAMTLDPGDGTVDSTTDASGADGGEFNYFDALDTELERRILRQLDHEVSSALVRACECV
jgi:hypothetical protein